MNNFDKAVEMNFRLIKDSIVTFVVLSVLFLGMSFMPLFALFSPFAYYVLVIVLTYRVYYKIFYKTTGGEGAALYNMLPITVKENIWSKIVVVMFFEVITVVVTIISALFIMYFTAWQGILYDVLDGFENLLGRTGIFEMVLLITDLFVVSFMQTMMLFYIILRFNMNKASSKKKNGTIVFTIIFLLINNLSGLAINFALEHTTIVILPVIIACEILISVAFYKLILKYFYDDLAL